MITGSATAVDEMRGDSVGDCYWHTLTMQARYTAILTALLPVIALSSSRPSAPHVSAPVAPGGEVLIRLPKSDPSTGVRLYARIRSLPAVGTLHYVSSLFDTYGYEPKRGSPITEEQLTLLLESSDNAVVYVPPVDQPRSPPGLWSTFTYSLSNGVFESNIATVWALPNHGRIAYSGFEDGAENWTIANNGAAEGAGEVKHEGYTRGLLSRYIVGQDKDIRLNRGGSEDVLRWTFVAPATFHGNHAAAYGGQLFLILGSIAGDFSMVKRQPDVNLITIECETCDEGRGIRLARWMDEQPEPFDGRSMRVTVDLFSSEWRLDPKSRIARWMRPTTCQMYDVLSAVSKVEVAGDLTVGAEAIALDAFGWSGGDNLPRECIHSD